MSRPPRIQFPGAIYHVTSRGNRRAAIFLDDRDYHIWLNLLAEVVEKFSIKVLSFCLMPNHFHLLTETPIPNLSEAMHMLNARYCQHFNKRHGTSGHAIHPCDWKWSNHRHVLAPETAPTWLETKWILDQFGSKDPTTRYASFVLAGIGKPNPLQLHRQIPNKKREQAQTLQEYAEKYPDQTEAMARAFQG